MALPAKPEDPFEERRKLVRAQTELQKQRLGGTFREAERQGKTQLDRLRAQTGGAGGALAKAAALQAKDLARSRGEAEAGVEAQGSALEQQIAQEQQAQKFAREERTGAQEFQAEQAKLTREQQAQQFERQLAEMSRQFDTEFTENQRTNFINAAIALKEAGLRGDESWGAFGEHLRMIYPEMSGPIGRARSNAQIASDARAQERLTQRILRMG